MIRLGFSGRIIGQAEAPRGAFSLRLLAFQEQLVTLIAAGVRVLRLPAALVPPENADADGGLLAAVGALAYGAGVRLTAHLPLRGGLASADAAVTQRWIAEALRYAALLDALGCGPDGTLVAHLGGVADDPAAAQHRFALRYERLPWQLRRRLAVETDEDGAGLPELLRLHQRTGVPVVLDTLHHQLNNQQALPLAAALGLALSTWPVGVRPKVHLSTQRTEAHVLTERGRLRVVAPAAGQHADFINPFEAIQLLEAARGLPPFDLLLEAKAGDLALLRLRADLRRHAPWLGGIVEGLDVVRD